MRRVVLINQNGRRDIGRHVVCWKQPLCQGGLNGTKSHVVGLIALHDETNRVLSHASSAIVKENGAVSAILVDSDVGFTVTFTSSSHHPRTVAQ